MVEYSLEEILYQRSSMGKKKKTKKKTGRPSKYTEELGTKICLLISQGVSVRNIEKMRSMPSAVTIYSWLLHKDMADFLKQYESACNIRARGMFDEITEIADTPIEGTETTDKEGEVTVKTGDMLGHRRLQIDARKWYLSKIAPKLYGDKLDLTSGDKPIENKTIIVGMEITQEKPNEDPIQD